MMKLIFSISLLLFLLSVSIDAQQKFTLNLTKTHQTIRGFGAADAWSNDYIKLWNDSLKNLAAKWLFSKETKPDGSFKGIGLSVWRFNLGAGSSEQGESSKIPDPLRRAESIIRPDGSFDEQRQSGTQWLLKAAKERGVENLIMFSNSPPVNLTRNGKAFSEICNKSNLAPENNEAYANYLTRSLQYFEENNIHFDYISPINEPEWGWCESNKQEGCPYTNEEIAGIVRILNKKISENKLSTQIQIPESGLLIFANPGFKFKPKRQNEIKNFFNKGKEAYVGDQSQIAKQICAHSYFTEWPIWTMRKVRKRIAHSTQKYNLEYWMTEYCILKTTREITGGGRDLGMHTALYVSRVIHHDLVFGNASSWNWWLGLSTEDYKDGLIYANREGTSIVDSKTMWALGNYSQFIQPGAIRVEVDGKKDKELFVSAYKNPGSDNLVIVLINMKSEMQKINLKNLPVGNLIAWETSELNNLKKTGEFKDTNQLTVSPKSVTTFVMKY